MLTWYEGAEVLEPLPHGGVAVHVDHLAGQALCDGRGSVKPASRSSPDGLPVALVVIPSRGVLDQLCPGAAVL